MTNDKRAAMQTYLRPERWTPSEPEEIREVLSAMLADVLADGGRKRETGTKPSWKVDSHRPSMYRHLNRWENGEQIDRDSGAHPLVHVATRALMIAWQETLDWR